MEINPSNLIVFETGIQDANIFPIPGYLTPPQIATAYNIPDNTGTGITVGVISVGGGFLQSDFNSSMSAMGLTTATINTILIDGAPGTFGVPGYEGIDQENTLDLYCIGGMVPHATINIYISLGNRSSAYNALIQAINDNCDVITLSWGIPEDEGGGAWLEEPLALAASKGITVLAAAGDTGSADSFYLVKSVYYPASSANVIAVGGTNLTINTVTNARISETVENATLDPGFGFGWGSGGGISTVTNLPPWQTGLTYKTYNSATMVTSGPFSLTMRGLPDISAPMNGYVLYYNGVIGSIGGTSAAAPIMAGMVARLKALTGSSKSSVSYNQLFYRNTGSFYDITSGNNATDIPQGYAATVGWDAVTGLGSPNGTQIYTDMLNDSSLSSLSISSVTLNPTFDPGVTSYTSTVPHRVLAVQVTPVSGETTATIVVNGVTTSSGSTSDFIDLNIGTNVIPVKVISINGASSTTYTTTITRSLSTDSTLFYLSISNGTLVPTFIGSTISYTDTVPNTVASVTVFPVANDSSSTIVVNGTPVISSTTSSPIALVTGTNIIKTVVTAQDRITTGTYTITITRSDPILSSDPSLSSLTISSGTLSPTFVSGTTSYTDSVINSVSSVTITPTLTVPSRYAIQIINSTAEMSGRSVVSGSPSSSIPLVTGTNSISVVTKSDDGQYFGRYNIILTRQVPINSASTDATLSNLTISSGTLSPGFSSGTTSYTDSVSHATTSITVTPTHNQAGATIKVNGTIQTSSIASGPINLSVGDNIISIIVIAEDGITTNTYTVTVTRLPSADATLSNLTISAGNLNPTFSIGRTSYTANVANTINLFAVTPTAHEPNATIKVNGISVSSGYQSSGISLAVGNNTITIVVTAQDGTTTDTYTLVVNKSSAPPSTNSKLNSLTISTGTLIPAFDNSIALYNDTVDNGVTSITVTPTTVDPNATIKVNGNTVSSGNPSNPVNLNVGINNATVVVTAQDGITSSTFSILISRLPSTDATLSGLTISRGLLTPSFNFNRYSYSSTVPYNVSSITVTPTHNQTSATIKVNGILTTSGVPSNPISLNIGVNTIIVKVIAQDNVTVDNYTIIVNRESVVTSTSTFLVTIADLDPSLDYVIEGWFVGHGPGL